MTLRLAFDSGATTSLVTEKIASALQLRRHPHRLQITGACGGGVSKHFVELMLQSTTDPSQRIISKFNVVGKLPASPPPSDVNRVKTEPHLQGLNLADPQLGGLLDVLLGGIDYSACILGSMTSNAHSHVSAQPTLFGWTISGPLDYQPSNSSVFQIQTMEDSLSKDLSLLWQMDRTPEEDDDMSPEDQAVTQYFLDTHHIAEDGRYVVRLPRVSHPPELGTSRNLALRRLQQNNKSLIKKGKALEYNKALSEYSSLEHAEQVPVQELSKPHYYLPVHGVFKETSSTTKVRPVFDASAPTSSGASLNDQLLQGPNLYPNLSDILLVFRTYSIGFSADISKMFREIRLHPEEQDLHRYLWESEPGHVQDMRMKRLTFGVRSSPYLATQVLRHLAGSHPEASQAIVNSFYVDDFLAGSSTVEEADHIRKQLCDLLNIAGMKLRKWRSNNSDFKATIPDELVETENLILSPSDRHLKALGIHWDVASDELSVSTPTIPDDQPTTKRNVASNIGKVFDLLGFFSPYTVSAKIILRKLWSSRIGWDDAPPESISQQWNLWKSQLHLISSVKIPRRYSENYMLPIAQALHGFADASQDAYGTVIYLQQTFSDNTSTSSIIISKARVLPLKETTIPRAELLAAHILAKLLHYCAKLLKVSTVIAWSDSSIVLCWLRKSPKSLNTFVANRVRAIHNLVPDAQWQHISSAFNPADLLSRGTTAEALIKSKLWWNGPPWIIHPAHNWPTPQFAAPSQLPETKVTVLLSPSTNKPKIWEAFSAFDHMVRIFSWCRRFLRNRRLPPEKRLLSPNLTTEEFNKTKLLLFSKEQKAYYPEIFEALKRNSPLPKGHILRKFKVSKDSQGLLSISTRIRDRSDSSLPTSLIPLPIRSSLVQLLLSSHHRQQRHPGVNTSLAILSSTYFIPGLKNHLKKISKHCPTCQRVYDRKTSQFMGLLPSVRTTPSPPFSHTGMDFAGPITTKRGYSRKPTLVKVYICLFTCLSTRATHLELCMDLSTDEFLAALRRFCARRGTPLELFSDNGTNFVGARNHFQQIYQLIPESKTAISHFCCSTNLKWNFIPPRAPHMGGAWEESIKQMKLLISKLVGSHVLKTDELASVIVEIEAMMNSKPIAPLDATNPDELALTPGHFLIGRPLVSPPSLPASQAKTTTLRRWQLVQRIQQDLWTQWQAHYLRTLQARQKWQGQGHTFKIGEVVYLRDETIAHRTWPLARITQTHPGSDGVVRVVDLTCQGANYRRDTSRLIPFMEEFAPPSAED